MPTEIVLRRPSGGRVEESIQRLTTGHDEAASSPLQAGFQDV